METAQQRYEAGEKFFVSTSIDEDTIIAGYGNLDYDFEFPLSNKTIIEIYGTTSWREYFAKKGLYQYITINRKNEKESITPYWTDAELKKHKKLNRGFKFQKL